MLSHTTGLISFNSLKTLFTELMVSLCVCSTACEELATGVLRHTGCSGDAIDGCIQHLLSGSTTELDGTRTRLIFL